MRLQLDVVTVLIAPKRGQSHSLSLTSLLSQPNVILRQMGNAVLLEHISIDVDEVSNKAIGEICMPSDAGYTGT